MAEHARRFKRSASVDERNLRKHVLPEWGRRRFDEIERRDVIALIEALVVARKPILANRVQALISTIYTFALDANLIAANPCTRLRRRGIETPRERVLSDAELRLFWSGIVKKPVSRLLGLALRLQLLTGVRPGEAAGMRRDEIEQFEDATRAGWVIPASRMKAKRAHYVPLSELARTTIKEALDLVPAGQPFLFASPKAEGPIRANALPIAMQRFAAALEDCVPGISSWKAEPPTPHDLRRTVATRLSAMGLAREDRKAVLGHGESDVHGSHYDTYDRAAEKRRALDAWGATLEAIIERRARNDNVISLHAQKS
jgi:integrase